MIIKGLFRRYKRWNPVHPTSGAFWGMGIGIGCGVGWGPGFGPEVVGYVGSGCGVGFNVGITFAGFGIGLPANVLIDGPYKEYVFPALSATGNYTLDLLRSSSFFSAKMNSGDEWNINIPFFPLQFSKLQQKANESFSYLKDLDLLKKETASSISLHTKSISEGIKSFKNRLSDPHKDNKD